MNSVAIFGVGLIGGSFALALRKAGFAGKILGVSSDATLRRALDAGIIDAAASPQTAAEEADLIYLSQPVLAILDSIAAVNDCVRPDALITDAGSSKVAIVQKAAQSLTRAQFLGGHPLAGKESRGLDSADAELFRGRTYVLTPQRPADLLTPQAVAFRSWLDRIGAVTVIVDSDEHDRTVALTSHLPQLASIALGMLLAERDAVAKGIFGPGLVDSTRLAMSAYEIWADILTTNSGAIDLALKDYISTLNNLRRDLQSPDMKEHFRSAATLAHRVRGMSTAT